MAFNYNAAKQAGFTDQQIGQYMNMRGVQSPQKKSIGGFASNVVKSGARTAGDLMGAVVNTFNPNVEKNTGANLLKLGAGVAQYLDPTQLLGTQYEDNARAVGNFYKDRYGSLDKIGNTLYNDPVGAALDVASVATGVGGGLRGAASLATKGSKAVSLSSNAAKAARLGNAFTKSASFVDPFSLIMKGGGKILSGNRAKLASKLDGAGESIVTRGIGNPAAQAKAAKKAGRSVSSFIDEYDLYNRSPESAASAKRGIMRKYDDLALNSGNQVQMGQLIMMFNDEIRKLQSGVGGVVSDANQAKIVELMKRRDQLLQAAGGAVDNGQLLSSPIQVGADTLTNFRRNVIDPDVPQSMYNLDARGSGAAQGVKQARDIVKSGIDSTDPRLAKLGKDYGMAKSIEKILTNSEARGNNRQVFNFTKLGGAGLGGIVAGTPAAIGGFAVETAVNHPKFIAGASKAMRSGASALRNPKIGQFSDRMGRITTPMYSYSKAGRMVNNASPDQRTPILANKQTQRKPQLETIPVSPSVTPYTQYPKLQPYQMPKQTKSAQAFGGNVKVKRGSFY